MSRGGWGGQVDDGDVGMRSFEGCFFSPHEAHEVVRWPNIQDLKGLLLFLVESTPPKTNNMHTLSGSRYQNYHD